ncbi:hypothetical protein [Pinibacter soli]|uniref:Transmembrane protein n=1 Tax=Pinibacter soli TaxID=3044211 RepID=A0ABT6RDM0_9BACT|nr:hypothetical protein [Pinibacter soli]MDI3319964.1 hypothetical protein [Pinibacter soli]
MTAVHNMEPILKNIFFGCVFLVAIAYVFAWDPVTTKEVRKSDRRNKTPKPQPPRYKRVS